MGVGIEVMTLNAWYGANHTLQDINLNIPANHATGVCPDTLRMISAASKRGARLGQSAENMAGNPTADAPAPKALACALGQGALVTSAAPNSVDRRAAAL